MSDYINATNNPQMFKKAVGDGKPVYADFPDGTNLEWNPTSGDLLYVWPSPNFEGDYNESVFPGLFKRNDSTFQKVFNFWDQIKG
jgi:hypothetical protein